MPGFSLRAIWLLECVFSGPRMTFPNYRTNDALHVVGPPAARAARRRVAAHTVVLVPLLLLVIGVATVGRRQVGTDQVLGSVLVLTVVAGVAALVLLPSITGSRCS